MTFSKKPFYVLLILGVISVFCAYSCKQRSDSKVQSTSHIGANDSKEVSFFRTGNRYVTELKDEYLDKIQPILSKRCAVCHSCTNGPCQLNVTSYEGVMRGIHKLNPYLDSSVGPTRLWDNLSVEEWRKKNFQPILVQTGDPQRNKDESILMQGLILGKRNKAQHNPYGGAFGIKKVRELAMLQEYGDNQCSVNLDEYADFKSEFPMGGMPWGCPAIEDQYFDVLEKWVEKGSKGPSSDAKTKVTSPQITDKTSSSFSNLIADWEEFLNGSTENDLKAKLFARFIYEHFYFSNMSFEENPGEFYKIVRSYTKAPQKIEQIASETALHPPGPDGTRFYYRIQKVDRVVELKTHGVWYVGRRKLNRFKELFSSVPWEVKSLPDYKSYNPFINFADLPAVIRARIVQEDARAMYQSSARGTICATQTATLAMDESTWLFFLRVESDPTVIEPSLGLSDLNMLYDPGENVADILFKKKPSSTYHRYREALERTIRKIKPKGLSIDDIWYGDGENQNAWLASFRHQTSTEAHHRGVFSTGGFPQKIWLHTYGSFERFYYNSVANYKYFGDAGHNYNHFVFQAFNNAEVEDMFISLLDDEKERKALREKWTGSKGRLRYGLNKDYSKGRASLTPSTDWKDLVHQIIARMPSSKYVDDLNNWQRGVRLEKKVYDKIDTIEKWEAGLRTITGREAPFGKFFPNIAHARVGPNKELYTFFVNRGNWHNKMITLEASDRRPDKDVVVAMRGLRGAYPHLVFDVSWEEASDFIKMLSAVNNLKSWTLFADRFKISRNSPEFWPLVDWMHDWLAKNEPIEGGILDFRYYDAYDAPKLLGSFEKTVHMSLGKPGVYMPACIENNGKGHGLPFPCKGGFCAKTDKTMKHWCLRDNDPEQLKVKDSFCIDNNGRGWGRIFKCGKYRCARTDQTYKTSCIIPANAFVAEDVIPKCKANGGKGYGALFDCSGAKCAKADAKYEKDCLVDESLVTPED